MKVELRTMEYVGSTPVPEKLVSVLTMELVPREGDYIRVNKETPENDPDKVHRVVWDIPRNTAVVYLTADFLEKYEGIVPITELIEGRRYTIATVSGVTGEGYWNGKTWLVYPGLHLPPTGVEMVLKLLPEDNGDVPPSGTVTP